MLRLRSRQDNHELALTITNRTVVRVLALVILSLLFLAALRRAEHALVLVFTAFFLALALNAPVHWLAKRLPGKRRGSRSIATTVSFLVVIAVLAAFLFSVVPPLVRQTSNFIDSVPNLISDVRDQNSSLGKFVRKYRLESQDQTVSSQLSARLKNVSSSAVRAVTHLTSSLFSVLTILVLTFMMLIEGPRWLALFSDLLPDNQEGHVRRLAFEMYHVVRGFVNGQVLLALIASVLITPMLFILHISYPAALIVVIFVCGLIPLVGHTIGAIVVTLVALFHSVPAAIAILAYYILYIMIENYIIQPRIQANSTNLSPLLVFIAVVVGVSFAGLLGGLVAIPIMGCLRVLAIDQVKRRHMLHEAATAETK
jgi:predicted PurR-regulated permease PerM